MCLHSVKGLCAQDVFRSITLSIRACVCVCVCVIERERDIDVEREPIMYGESDPPEALHCHNGGGSLNCAKLRGLCQ